MRTKSLLLFAIILSVIAASCQSGGAGKKVKLNNEIDSTSYAIGVLIGQQNKQVLENFPGGDKIDLEIMTAAFLKAIQDEITLMDPDEANEVVGAYLENINNREAQENLEEGNAFLEGNKRRDGVMTTDSGLQYEILVQGDGPRPGEEDVVKVHYHGTLVDGTVFDSSMERGEPVEFPVGQVIRGWVEALQLMPVGSRWKVYIPGDLGYGDRGAGGDIGPNAVLIFEIELIDIVS